MITIYVHMYESWYMLKCNNNDIITTDFFASSTDHGHDMLPCMGLKCNNYIITTKFFC